MAASTLAGAFLAFVFAATLLLLPPLAAAAAAAAADEEDGEGKDETTLELPSFGIDCSRCSGTRPRNVGQAELEEAVQLSDTRREEPPLPLALLALLALLRLALLTAAPTAAALAAATAAAAATASSAARFSSS